ncbi:hypothetical protein N7V09_17485 [Shewanella seohaensis]|uniref:hypothetical protein n=1 Tax=Shewanella seohaensis TaxID=755175 RepID=UPI0021C6F3CB|nr:hypothetical protein [Shewanella seohaensis]UXM81506.1 hypothetical protein N7V09_17485 [Shewanella seohaensis]
MQIQAYRNTAPYQQPAAATTTSTAAATAAPASANTVTLSNEAKQLSQVDPIPQPHAPDLSKVKAGVEQYAHIQATKMKYQVASDMVNIAMGTNDEISAPTAYYLSHNDSARAATVGQMANQQQVNTLQAYVDASESTRAC